MQTHYFDTTIGAYDASQCDDSIHDGDILIATDENVVGILVKAWPVAVTAKHGSFHTLGEGVRWSSVDGNDYSASYHAAEEMIVAHQQALEG